MSSGMLRRRMANKVRRELATGFYAVIVLMMLGKYGACYGYKLIKLIKELSEGFLNPSESTVYGLLRSFERDGLVTSYWAESEGRVPRKYYELTDKGREFLEEVVGLVDSFLEAVERVRGELR